MWGEVVATSGLSPANNGAQTLSSTLEYGILKGIFAKYLTNTLSSCSRLTHFKLKIQKKKKILATCSSKTNVGHSSATLSFVFFLLHSLPPINAAPALLSANPINCSPRHGLTFRACLHRNRFF